MYLFGKRISFQNQRIPIINNKFEIQRGQELRNRINKINHMKQKRKNNFKYPGVDKIHRNVVFTKQ